jgi:hypothetical protein
MTPETARIGALGQHLQAHGRADGSANEVDDRIQRPADDVDQLARVALADCEHAIAGMQTAAAIGRAAVEYFPDRDEFTIGAELYADAFQGRLLAARPLGTARQEVLRMRIETARIGIDEELEDIFGIERRGARAELLVTLAQDVTRQRHACVLPAFRSTTRLEARVPESSSACRSSQGASPPHGQRVVGLEIERLRSASRTALRRSSRRARNTV